MFGLLRSVVSLASASWVLFLFTTGAWSPGCVSECDSGKVYWVRQVNESVWSLPVLRIGYGAADYGDRSRRNKKTQDTIVQKKSMLSRTGNLQRATSQLCQSLLHPVQIITNLYPLCAPSVRKTPSPETSSKTPRRNAHANWF